MWCFVSFCGCKCHFSCGLNVSHLGSKRVSTTTGACDQRQVYLQAVFYTERLWEHSRNVLREMSTGWFACPEMLSHYLPRSKVRMSVNTPHHFVHCNLRWDFLMSRILGVENIWASLCGTGPLSILCTTYLGLSETSRVVHFWNKCSFTSASAIFVDCAAFAIFGPALYAQKKKVT